MAERTTTIRVKIPTARALRKVAKNPPFRCTLGEFLHRVECEDKEALAAWLKAAEVEHAK
jgi:hypothetical protein